MAQKAKQISIPKIDFELLKKRDEYAKLLDNLKKSKDPMKIYKDLTVLRETSNPLTMAEGGNQLLDDLIENVSSTLDPKRIENEFKPIEMNPELSIAVEKDIDKALKTAYNLYTYSEGTPDSKYQQRNIYTTLKRKAIDMGRSPDEILNSNAFISGLNFVSNLASIPSNLLAKATAALWNKSGKVKIWGGSGWEDTFRAINETPEIQTLLEKKSNSIPLNQKEKIQLKAFDDKYAGLGLVFNIVADPLLIAGALGKGIGLAAKAGKSTKLLGISNVLKAIEQPIKTAKNIKYIRNLDKAGEMTDLIKNNIRFAKSSLDNIPQSLLKQADSILDATGNIDYKAGIKTLDQFENIANTLNKPEVFGKLSKANKAIKDTAFEMEAYLKGKPYAVVDETSNKLKRFISNKVDKMGLRRAFISDVPVTAELSTGIEGATGIGAKEVFDAPRREMAGVANKLIGLNNNIKQKVSKELLPEIKSNKAIESYMAANKLDIQDVINELIEKPNLRKQFNIKSTAIDEINNLMDDYIISDVKLVGSKAVPLLSSEIEIKEWKKLADEFQTVLKTNAFDTRLSGIESKLRNILKKKVSNQLMDDDLLDMADANIVYFTHAMDEAAKKYWSMLDGRNRNLFGQSFKSFISSPSFRKRGFTGSTVDINKYFLDPIDDKGTTRFVQDLYKEAKENKFKLVEQAIKRDVKKTTKASIANAEKKLGKFNKALDSLNNVVIKNNDANLTDRILKGEEIFLTKEGNLKVANYIKKMINAYKKTIVGDNKLVRISDVDMLGSLDKFKDLLRNIKIVEKPGMQQLKNEVIDGLKFLNSIEKELKKKVIDNSKSIIEFAENMREIAKRLREGNNKFFSTDISKLLALRGARSARTIQEARFYDGIIQFGREARDALSKEEFATWRKPVLQKQIPGISDMYYHPDIASAVEKVYNYTSDDRFVKKILNHVNDIQTLWKSMTLSLFPSTVFRNVLGNITNSLLATNKPGGLVQSTKDALSILKNKNYDIITETGKIVNSNQILHEATKRGIFATTYKAEEIDKALKSEGAVGGVSYLKKIAEKIGQAPTAQLNNFAEGTSKLALFIQKIKEGMSYDDAANTVFKVLFDYGDLSTTDKAIKGVVPFWCVDIETEILTETGWKYYTDINISDKIWTLNINNNISEWKEIEDMFIGEYKGELVSIENRNISALVTNNHKWCITDRYSKMKKIKMKETNELNKSDIFIIANNNDRNVNEIYEDDYVKLIGWIIGEGHYRKKYNTIEISQSHYSNPEKCKEIENILSNLKYKYYKYKGGVERKINYYCISGDIGKNIKEKFKKTELNAQFINELSNRQINILIETLIKADGYKSYNNYGFVNTSKENADIFSMACNMIGLATYTAIRNNMNHYGKKPIYVVTIKNKKYVGYKDTKIKNVYYNNIVWCPHTENGTFLARRNGKVYYTGNTWTRKNIPLQLANLLSVPSRTLLKLEHSFNTDRPSDELVDERSMSEWMKTATKMKIGTNPKTGRQEYLLLEGIVPLFDLSRINRALTGDMKLMIDDIIKDISPIIKTPIELATNRSFAFHKDIERSKLDTAEFLGFEISPKLKSILDDWRILNLLNKGVDVKKLVSGNKGVSVAPEKDFTRMMMSWMLGTPVPYDPYYSRIVQSRDFKRELQNELLGFKANLKKKSLSLMQKREMTESDLNTIRARGKNILLMINEAYSDGKLDSKERIGYIKMLIKAFNQ